MNSILEEQRHLHEEVEQIELVISKELICKPKNHKEKIKQEHRISRFLERIMQRNAQLFDIYKDQNEARKKEIDIVLAQSDFSEFYRRLKDIKDVHRRFPDEPAELLENEFKRIDKDEENQELETMFTGEENFGKFVDLNENFHQFVNLKGIDPIDYLTYLDIVSDFGKIPLATKNTSAYKRYLENLVTYLKGFLLRAQPLLNLEIIQNEAMKSSDQEYEAEADAENESLFCNACQKQFSKETVFQSHLTGKKHIKAQEILDKTGNRYHAENNKEKIVNCKKKYLELEILAQKLLEAISQEKIDTRAALERKQTLTVEEYTNLVEETKDDIIEPVVDEKALEEKFYNPLKLPIGWDGKPIPFWLYKLHGLGIEYPCEICGNFVYMGRKAFQRHFKETRHAQSMRNLGIPNTKEFREITKINDALELWTKIQKEAKIQEAKTESMEEFEDANGNVYNKKTYEDLKRQGLL